MTKFKKLNSAKIFIDYKPAELRQNKDWIIIYYARVPASDKMKLFRVRVPKIKKLTERKKYAKKMEVSINQKLESGWTPFYDNQINNYKSIDVVFDSFLQISEKEVKDGVKRIDTIRGYKSLLKIFRLYLSERATTVKFLIEIDINTISSFLDYVYLERNASPRTYNNYLRFLNTLFFWCKSKGYLQQNPAENIKKKQQQQKKREVLGLLEKEKLNNYGVENKEYYTLCMCTYYSFLRRTELTKIKVSEVNLKQGFITVLGENSKNRKTENVTIPNNLLPLLIDHLKNANNSDFLFSKNDFKAGKQQLPPKKISDEWAKFRKTENVENKFQFYSLKDTGITDLLNSGIAAIKVRDQARHHDLKITEGYTQRNATFDAAVKNAVFSFSTRSE